VAHLLVEGRKMSKSLGNFFTVRDFLAKGFTGREIRQLLLSANFRETFNFTLDGLEGARSAVARIDECVGKLTEIAGSVGPSESRGADPLETALVRALDDDLNVSQAWAAVFDWVRETNRALAGNQLSASQAADTLAAWRRVDGVFGLGVKAVGEVPADILALAEERVAAKKARDFARADAIRQELKVKGWLVEDTAKGPKLKPTT